MPPADEPVPFQPMLRQTVTQKGAEHLVRLPVHIHQCHWLDDDNLDDGTSSDDGDIESAFDDQERQESDFHEQSNVEAKDHEEDVGQAYDQQSYAHASHHQRSPPNNPFSYSDYRYLQPPFMRHPPSVYPAQQSQPYPQTPSRLEYVNIQSFPDHAG